MPTIESQFTADFIRSTGSDLTGVEILTAEVPPFHKVTRRNERERPAASPTIKITARFDTSTPTLFKLYSSGELIPKVVIRVKPAAEPPYLITLTDVEVADFSHQSDGTSAIRLSYSRMEETWLPQPTDFQGARFMPSSKRMK